MTIKPFGSVESALRALLLVGLPTLATAKTDWTALDEQLVEGDFLYEASMPFFIRLDKVSSSADRFEGDFIVDVEVFGVNYLETESRSLDIESLLLGYPHVVEVGSQKWVFDSVFQNTGPDELPWEDDEVSRLGATYVITARRR